MIICAINSCSQKVAWKELCKLHYYRQYRTGDANWQPTQVKGVSKRRSPLYNTYWNMIKRCSNLNSPDYKNYGGRGIKICERWQGSEGFYNFANDMGEKPSPKHSINRTDNNGNYEPSNCEWATSGQQNINRRDVKTPYISKLKNHNFYQLRVKGKYLGIYKNLIDAERIRDGILGN